MVVTEKAAAARKASIVQIRHRPALAVEYSREHRQDAPTASERDFGRGFGLERPLNNLMSVFKAAAQGFGPERRVLLLHGPVGSSKSTIVRLLKKGLEAIGDKKPDETVG